MTVEVIHQEWLIAGISIWYFVMIVWCRVDPNGPMWGGDDTIRQVLVLGFFSYYNTCLSGVFPMLICDMAHYTPRRME